jgi:hypothetical protein
MATRIFAVGPDGRLENAIETVGPTATSAAIAIVVDLASVVTDGSSSRAASKQEVLKAIDTLKAKILKANWPPA